MNKSFLGVAWCILTALALCQNSFAQSPLAVPAPTELATLDYAEPHLDADSPPTRTDRLPLEKLIRNDDTRLYGIQNRQELDFTLRRDQLVSRASLELIFTPSPALLPKLSHLLVYLNDELMVVVPIAQDASMGQQKRTVTLDPRFLSTYNRLRLELVGHYTDICEDPAHSSLWVDISKQTRVIVHQQTISVANDLAFFPEPFLDTNDMQDQNIPFVFGQTPDTTTLEAAAILASYFGSKAQWRVARYPVHINSVPDHNAIVLASNDNRPDFLADYPPVNQPVIEMITMPGSRYKKLLLVLGRDSQDLKHAVQALSLGDPLLRGQAVQIDEVRPLQARKPYDAPNWLPVDRPVRFTELVEYPGQLETHGPRPAPIRLNLNLPPDLFVWRSHGIPLKLIYRYTRPATRDDSRMTLSLNQAFMASYPLLARDQRSALEKMHLPVIGNDPVADVASFPVPALRVGSRNQLEFNFSFAETVGNADPNSCRTQLPTVVRASIDGHSSIDFNGYAHYIEMPNLKAFANSGFPFSRMADLSETTIVLPAKSDSGQIATLLAVANMIGSYTGYPAYKATITSDWEEVDRDTDILWIGDTPEDFKLQADANFLLHHLRTTLNQPLNRLKVGDGRLNATHYHEGTGTAPSVQIGMTAVAPIAALVGMASPFQKGRSMVGLLGSTDDDLMLIREALIDTGKRNAIQGSVSIVRSSGVSSELIGPTYFVGDLKWWQRLWFHLSDKPILLASLSVLLLVMVAFLLWQALRAVAAKRVGSDG